MRSAVLAATLSSVVTTPAPADPAVAAIRAPTSIGPQALGSALRTLAADRHLQILYTTDTIANLTTGGAIGELTVSEALERLLGGTGLVFRYVDESTITIVRLASSRRVRTRAPTHRTSRTLRNRPPSGTGFVARGRNRRGPNPW